MASMQFFASGIPILSSGFAEELEEMKKL